MGSEEDYRQSELWDPLPNTEIEQPGYMLFSSGVMRSGKSTVVGYAADVFGAVFLESDMVREAYDLGHANQTAYDVMYEALSNPRSKNETIFYGGSADRFLMDYDLLEKLEERDIPYDIVAVPVPENGKELMERDHPDHPREFQDFVGDQEEFISEHELDFVLGEGEVQVGNTNMQGDGRFGDLLEFLSDRNHLSRRY